MSENENGMVMLVPVTHHTEVRPWDWQAFVGTSPDVPNEEDLHLVDDGVNPSGLFAVMVFGPHKGDPLAQYGLVGYDYELKSYAYRADSDPYPVAVSDLDEAVEELLNAVESESSDNGD